MWVQVAPVPSELAGNGLTASRSVTVSTIRKLTGEHASADHEAAETFPAQLTQLIEDNGYVPEQVFNADETGLFWGKKCPQELSSSSERAS